MTEEKLRKYISLYHGAVFRLAYSYLKNRADAECTRPAKTDNRKKPPPMV